MGRWSAEIETRRGGGAENRGGLGAQVAVESLQGLGAFQHPRMNWLDVPGVRTWGTRRDTGLWCGLVKIFELSRDAHIKISPA